MIIDKFSFQNSYSKNVSLHDDIFNSLIFDNNSGSITISATEAITERDYSINFLEVIGFEMSNCDFWGVSPHIFDFECLDEDDYIVSKTPCGAKKSMRKKLTIAPCQHPTKPSVRRISDLSPTFCPSEIFPYLCP